MVFPAIGLWFTLFAAYPGYGDRLTASQEELLEALNCEASLEPTIVETRSVRPRLWDVFFACEPHGSVQGHALRETRYCIGAGRDWNCKSTGIEIDMPPGKWEKPLAVSHTTAERALEIYAFLEQESRKRKQIDPDYLDGYTTITWVEGNHNYNVTFTFSDWEYLYYVTERCKDSGCRRKLEYVAVYQSWADFFKQ